MRVQSANLEVSRVSQVSRWWSVLSCPRCGGIIVLETTGPNEPPQVLKQVPEAGAEVNVEHLPEDVEADYRVAIRVLEAGVPDADPAGKITTEFGGVLHHIRGGTRWPTPITRRGASEQVPNSRG